MKWYIGRYCAGSVDYVCDYSEVGSKKAGKPTQGGVWGMPCSYDKGRFAPPKPFTSLRKAKVALKKLVKYWNMTHFLCVKKPPRFTNDNGMWPLTNTEKLSYI